MPFCYQLTSTHSEQPLFQDLAQAQWKKMLPDLGDASPEIAILHVDPKTEATQLLIRTPKALHVPATLAFGKRDPHNDQWQRNFRM